MRSTGCIAGIIVSLTLAHAGGVHGDQGMSERNVFGDDRGSAQGRSNLSGGARTPDNFFERMGVEGDELVITGEEIERFTEAVFDYKPLFYEIQVRSMLGQEGSQTLKREFESRTERILSRHQLSAKDYAVFDRVAQQMPEFQQYMANYAQNQDLDFGDVDPPETIDDVVALTQDNTDYDVEELLNPDEEESNSGGLPEGFDADALGSGAGSGLPGGM